jgi:hypothetical protein
MGPVKYENVGKSQPVLVMINLMIFTRTRSAPPQSRDAQSRRLHREWNGIQDQEQAMVAVAARAPDMCSVRSRARSCSPSSRSSWRRQPWPRPLRLNIS